MFISSERDLSDPRTGFIVSVKPNSLDPLLHNGIEHYTTIFMPSHGASLCAE